LIKWVIAATTIMLVIPAAVEAMEPADVPPPFTVQNIEYESFDGAGKLEIETNEQMEYIVYVLEDPHRIVIDPLDAVWCDFEEAIYFPDGVVRSIKFVRSRDLPDGPGTPYYPFDFVAIELSGPLPYDFSEDDLMATLNIGVSSPEAILRANLEEAVAIESKLIEELSAKEELAREREARIKAVEEKLIKEREELARREDSAGSGEDLAQEKAEIVAAKDELFKKNVALQSEKAALNKVKLDLAKEKEELQREREKIRKRMKFEPRPDKRFTGEDPPPDYYNKTLTLKDCVDIAMSNSMLISVAKEKEKLSRMKVNESFRELFPEFSLMWDETKGKISDAFYVGRKFGLEFKQVITHGGEQISLWEQAKVNMKIAKESLNKEKERLIFDVSKAYYEAVKAARKHYYQKALIDDIQGDFTMVKKEQEYELISKIDFMNVESMVSRIEHAAMVSENSAALSMMELNKVMGIDINARIDIEQDLPEEEIEIDSERCISLALQFKPEYRISYLQTEVAKLSSRIADAQMYPQIDIFGKFLKAAEHLEPLNVEPLRHFLDNEKTLGATVTVPLGPHTLDYQRKEVKLAPTVTTFGSDTEYKTDKLRLNLFDNMARHSGVKDASVKYKESLEEFNKAEQDIYTEINTALFSMKEASIKMQNSKNDISLYAKEIEVAHVRKGLNDISFYDLIEAKSKLYNEKGSYAEALSDYRVAVARVNKAIGIGGYFQ
jgi:outer membrane protein TolC